LSIEGTKDALWNVGTDQPWMTVAPTSGTIPGTATLTVDPALLDTIIANEFSSRGARQAEPTDEYVGTATFTSGSAETTVTVRFRMAFEEATISVDPEVIDLGDVFLAPGVADAAPRSFSVFVLGTTGFAYGVSTDQTWLTVNSTGVIPSVDTLNVTIPADLPTGQYEGTAIFAISEDLFDTVTVRFNLVRSPTGSGLLLDPSFIKTNFFSSAPQRFSINVKAASPEIVDFQWSAYSPYPWATVEPASGVGPATVTLIIDPSKLPFSEDQLFTDDPTTDEVALGPVAIVQFNSTIGDAAISLEATFNQISYDLTVTPSQIEVIFTRANLAPKEFVVNVRNANAATQQFDWSAESPDAGITVLPDRGSAAGEAVIRVDPLFLSGLATPAEETEDGAQQIGRIGTFTVTFSSSLLTEIEDTEVDTATATVTITVILYDAQELTTSPSYLFFSTEAIPAPETGVTVAAPEPFTGTIEVAEGTPVIPDFTEQYIFISAGPKGWSASFDAPWLEVNALPGETEPGVFTDTTLSSEFPTGTLRVVPRKEVLTNFGRYETSIRVVDRESGYYREVPVTVEVLRPGEISRIPVPPPEYIQSHAGFVLLETCDAHRVNMDLDLGIMEGSERVYVLVEAPHLVPGVTYAWTPYLPKVLQVVSVNGVPVPGADSYYYSGGPIPEVPIENLYLRGLSGKLVLRTQVGQSIANSREVQRVELNIATPIGQWQLTDRLLGQSYTYDAEISHQVDAEPVDGYLGNWGTGTQVVMAYGDTRTHLYRVMFEDANGMGYVYDVISLTANEMVGQWSWGGKGEGGGPEDFWGQKTLGIQ